MDTWFGQLKQNADFHENNWNKFHLISVICGEYLPKLNLLSGMQENMDTRGWNAKRQFSLKQLKTLDRLLVPNIAVLDTFPEISFQDSGKLWSLKRSRNTWTTNVTRRVLVLTCIFSEQQRSTLSNVTWSRSAVYENSTFTTDHNHFLPNSSYTIILLFTLGTCNMWSSQSVSWHLIAVLRKKNITNLEFLCRIKQQKGLRGEISNVTSNSTPEYNLLSAVLYR